LAVAPRSGLEAPPEPSPTRHRHGSGSEDALLLERWQAGDRDAGGHLVRKHHAGIAGFFANTASDGERQDLTQQTFERITRGKARFRGHCSVRTYFFRVAHGVLVYHLRRRYRRDFDPLAHSVEDVDGVTPSRIVAELGRTHALLTCLRGLPLAAKQLLELYYWHGLTAAELGGLFEAPEGTIRRRVFDAKAKLRACACKQAAQHDETKLDEQLRELGLLLCVGPTGV
jgi:RNA polymerase sigma-70 factor (ECF subfamily)